MTTETRFYALSRIVVRTFFETCYRQEVYGTHHLPASGAYILASNHASLLDPPLIGYPIPRPIYFLARRSLIQSRATAWLFRRLNAIAMNREGADVQAFKAVLSTLEAGDPVLVFPEGTRTPDGSLQSAKKGVGLIACRSQAPVVPARIYGSFQAWGRNRKWPSLHPTIEVVYGRPLRPHEYDPGREADDRYGIAARTIMGAIEALSLPPDRTI